MKRLVLKLLLFGALVGGVCLVVLAAAARGDGYAGAVLDKQARLQRLGSPKLVVVGGSGTAFSVHGAALSDAVGLPVVNMGVKASVGLRYLLEVTAAHVGAEDVVLVVPEYAFFYGMVDGEEGLLEVVARRPTELRYLRAPGQVAALVRYLPVVLNQSLLSLLPFGTPDEVYRRSGFNAVGDMTGHWEAPPQTERVRAGGILPAGRSFDPAAVRLLARFAERAGARGARVFVAYPAIPHDRAAAHEEELRAVHAALAAEPALTLLGAPADFTLDEQHFFDTPYHATRTGGAAATTRLAAHLSQVLAAPAVPATAAELGNGVGKM